MDYDYDNAKRRLFIPRYVAIAINALAICFAVSKFIVFSIEVLPGDEIIEGIELIYLFILTLLFLLDIFLLASDSIIGNRKRLLKYYKLDMVKGIVFLTIACTYTYYIKGEAYIPFFGCHFLTNNPGCAMNIIGLTIIWFMPAYYIIICQLLWFWIKKSVQNIVEVSGVDTGNPFLSVFQSSRLADSEFQSSRLADSEFQSSRLADRDFQSSRLADRRASIVTIC
ncbi:hypothetical protein F8M41_017484 [Gigaspora margarita]|uniref:Uncharacterized protein n=1 Tax=Gigaspora margarita TaxID=4874 RepID=A0A8H4AN02_GIGMA|nr:hypothetical protein F8M41_017484 [Gigaspora margarita]